MDRVKLKIERVSLLPDEEGGIAPPGAQQLQLRFESDDYLKKVTPWLTCVPWEEGWYDLKGEGPFQNKELVDRAFYKPHDGTSLHGLWFIKDGSAIGADGLVSIGWHNDIMNRGFQWRGLWQAPRRALV